MSQCKEMTSLDGQSIKPGDQVKVINRYSDDYGRTGQVQALVSYIGGAGGPFAGPATSRGWRIVFNWPLGGIKSVAVVRENELEII